MNDTESAVYIKIIKDKIIIKKSHQISCHCCHGSY